MSDHDEVRSLIARVAQTADSATDLEEYVELFTPDAVWQMGGTTLTGHDPIRAGAVARRSNNVAGPGSHAMHLISTTAVSIDDDAAIATSYWQFFTTTDTAPTLALMGAYRDTAVRTGAGWRIARREVTT